MFNPLKGVSGYGWHFEQEVFLPKGIARALKAGGGSGNIPKVILNDNYMAICAAMRGRYNSDGNIEQKIEVRNDELSNTITTVQKDNLIIEKKQ